MKGCSRSGSKLFKRIPRKLLSYEPLSKDDIKFIRHMYDLSQRCFAQMLDINVRTLHNYEMGHRMPSQTATALFNFAKNGQKYFSKFLKGDIRPFER